MRSIAFSLCCTGFAALSQACDEELICTEELRVAVRVHVTSTDDRPVDRVTADLEKEEECPVSLESDASEYGIFRCTEQGGGSYTIRVYSGAMIWSTNVRVDANECHTLEIEDVEIKLDPASADHDD